MSTSNPVPSILPGTVLRGKYKLLSRIGQGAFGQTYSAEESSSGEKVAIKVEGPQCKKKVLKMEAIIIKRLQDCPHVCKYYGCGTVKIPPELLVPTQTPPVGPEIGPTTGKQLSPTTPEEDDGAWTFLAMQLLGSNLAELRKKRPNSRFSVVTTALVVIDMLAAIEEVHMKGYIHRDVKPSNFAMGLERLNVNYGRPRCYLIDFGMARRYVTNNGALRQERHNAGFRGTARYASIAAHQGRDLGRVDDLWSLFYVMVEFLKGCLPWRKEKDKDKIGDMKAKQHQQNRLLVSMPQACIAWYEHLSNLTFGDAPDYGYLRRQLVDLFISMQEADDVPYDWDQVADPSEVGTTSNHLVTSAGTAGYAKGLTTAPKNRDEQFLSEVASVGQVQTPWDRGAVQPANPVSQAAVIPAPCVASSGHGNHRSDPSKNFPAPAILSCHSCIDPPEVRVNPILLSNGNAHPTDAPRQASSSRVEVGSSAHSQRRSLSRNHEDQAVKKPFKFMPRYVEFSKKPPEGSPPKNRKFAFRTRRLRNNRTAPGPNTTDQPMRPENT